MSERHPIIAVTGSSGANRGRVRDAFDLLFRREDVQAVYVDGDCFHRFSRSEMQAEVARRAESGLPPISHFGPEANLFSELEALYRAYGETGGGRRRFYIHNAEEAEALGAKGVCSGEFTPWKDLPPDTDCLLYEGLHGWVSTDGVDLRELVDLKIGVVPIINQEWIQKIHRDTQFRGYSTEAVVDTILRRMPDYVRYVVPQFRRSDINFQRVPVVDTSDPIVARDVPNEDEAVVVIRFRRPEDFAVDFPYLLKNIDGAFMSRRNTIVVPGGKMNMAIQLVLTPIIQRLLDRGQARVA